MSKLSVLSVAFAVGWTGIGVAQPGKVPEDVWHKAWTNGVVGVIVELHTDVPTTPEGALHQPAQRGAIVAAQDKLVASLARTKYRVIHRLLMSPIIGLVVGMDALAVLDRSPLVERVQWDGPPSRLVNQSVPTRRHTAKAAN